jgi:Ran GTPase-activating protein (RanGAP) involved in mRNA processing and transport
MKNILVSGMKIANLRRLEVLKLRGNDLTDRALEYIKDGFDGKLFLNLRVLDLRCNNLGNDCCLILARMIILNNLLVLESLLFQHNNIQDLGFQAIIKILKSLQHKKCNNLKILNYRENKISSQCIRNLFPLPSCILV